jgi:hypothetical protein
MSELHSFFYFEIGLLIEHGQNEGCITINHKIHFYYDFSFLEYVLLFLNAQWLEYFTYPSKKYLISLILKECDLRDHLFIDYNS